MDNYIAEYRKIGGYTQDDLAKAIGTNRTTIAFIESGKRQLKYHEVIGISNFFGLAHSYIFQKPTKKMMKVVKISMLSKKLIDIATELKKLGYDSYIDDISYLD